MQLLGGGRWYQRWRIQVNFVSHIAPFYSTQLSWDLASFPFPHCSPLPVSTTLALRDVVLESPGFRFVLEISARKFVREPLRFCSRYFAESKWHISRFIRTRNCCNSPSSCPISSNSGTYSHSLPIAERLYRIRCSNLLCQSGWRLPRKCLSSPPLALVVHDTYRKSQLAGTLQLQCSRARHRSVRPSVVAVDLVVILLAMGFL